jgi:hypothetical protein
MSEPVVSLAWASTAVGDLLCGRLRDATVRASTKVASYLTVPDPGSDPGVVALLSQAAVRLPIGIVLATDNLPEAGSTVRIGNGSVTTEQGTWRPARWWDPRPHLSVGALLAAAPALRELLETEAGPCFGLPLCDALDLAGALAHGELTSTLAAIGLGPGLTPAGDDVVAGALAVLALCGQLDEVLKAAIGACARSRTTALSAALIVAASRGQVIPQAAAVLNALAAGDPPDRLSSAVTGLFAVGATSGHDLCAGMAGALSASATAYQIRARAELATTTRRPL